MRLTQPQNGNRRVLITDSTALGTQLLANALRKATGHEVHVSSFDQTRFERKVATLKPDILLISVDSEGMRGLARRLIEIARFRSHSARTIVLLQAECEQEIAEAYRLGASTVITAHQHLVQLIRCINTVSPDIGPETTTDSVDGLTSLAGWRAIVQ